MFASFSRTSLLTILHFILFLAPAFAQIPAVTSTNNMAVVAVDVVSAPRTPALAPELFGFNLNWLDSGGGVLEFGELLRDRSFRNQATPATQAWIESPNALTGGRVLRYESGGDALPWSGKGYPGFVSLAQEKTGYTCVSQTLREALVANASYELHVSARAEGGKPALSVFFADASFMPVEALDNLSWIPSSNWTDYVFNLTPSSAPTSGMVRLCLVTSGQAGIDEVRLRRLGEQPRIRNLATTRIKELGLRSLRWPAGSDADFFDWRESIGPLHQRGESPSAFGVYQTPSLGLHEFLNYCEANGIVPLITVNIRQSAGSAAELVEYILGAATSTMGTLRAKNGRTKPWNVKHFELGNEPTEAYRAGYSKDDTAKGYVALASGVATAMRAKAASLGKPISLKGVLETTFTIADWISLVPMLSRWNQTTLDKKNALWSQMDNVKGNFYSAFTSNKVEQKLFEEVMAGGATLSSSLKRLNKDFGPLPRFWLTEYSLLVQEKDSVGQPTVNIPSTKNFMSGLAAADILMTAMQQNYGGAYLFNLSQTDTWGVLANPQDFRIRPAGLAFSMMAPFAGQRLLPLSIEGTTILTADGGAGNNPSRMNYSMLDAVATKLGSGVQVVILNRSYGTDMRVKVSLNDTTATRIATVQQLGPELLTANNDTQAGTVQIKKFTASLNADSLVTVPARTLVRIVYPSP